MLTDDLLLNNGYKQFEPGPWQHEGITDMFQKRFDDEVGKKYFITINKWRGWVHPHTGEEFPPSYEITVQFTYNDNPVDMNFFHWDYLDEAEKKIEEIWHKCRFDYYETFDGEDRRVSREDNMDD